MNRSPRCRRRWSSSSLVVSGMTEALRFQGLFDHGEHRIGPLVGARARLHVDTRKPYVGRTQYTRTWYWKCERCTRREIMSGSTHAQVLAAALVHARSWPHYYALYSTKPS